MCRSARVEKRHSKDTTVCSPGEAEPTRGRDNHKAESVEFFKTFPDNHLINHPYKVEIAQGEWTCTIADFTGTMRGSSRRVFSHEDEIETTYNGHGDI